MKIVARLRSAVAHSLWFIPSVFVVAAIVLALVTTALDDATEGRPFTELVFTGGPDSAHAILQTVAGAVITFTALVFSITVLALQLSSQQFSPRVLRTFLRDRLSKFALGTFIGTFIYCLMVLRVISSSEDRGVTIPSISMMVLLVLVLASVGMFVSYISHMANSIRVSHIVLAVGDETRALIKALPEAPPRAVKDRSLFDQPKSDQAKVLQQGSLTRVDHDGLVKLATEKGVALELKRAVGDFVAEGQTLADIRGGDVDDELVWRHFSVALERTMDQDIAFGLRQLIDVAEKALSPSTNDPTTAVMAIDQMHDVLRRLAPRDFSHAEYADENGVVRVVTQPLEWDALVELAFSEIRQFAGSSLQVTRRLMAVLDDLQEVALPDRKAILSQQRELLVALVQRSFDEEHDRRIAVHPDQQGIGSD